MNWRDLAEWLRAYIISTVWELSDRDTIRGRLNTIPSEMGDNFGLSFGDQISDDYTNLLSSFIAFIEAIIDAQKTGDDAAVNQYMEQVHDIIHHATAMLSQINPFWQESEWRAMFFKFLILTIDETNAFLSGDNVKGNKIFEALLSLAAIMNDYFSNGLYEYHTSR